MDPLKHVFGDLAPLTCRDRIDLLQREVDIARGESVIDLQYVAVLCPACRAPTNLTGSLWLRDETVAEILTRAPA
ncbi:MAG: hypothetical protein I8H71_02680 [Xanthomonadaceae bacterium]|nr:hypothetical protein [Xanthomonadaceae bacterium]